MGYNTVLVDKFSVFHENMSETIKLFLICLLKIDVYYFCDFYIIDLNYQTVIISYYNQSFILI